MQQIPRKLMMTLVLLLTAATSAWAAESKPIGLNVEYAAGDVITSTTDVYVWWGYYVSGGDPEDFAIKITSSISPTISMLGKDASSGFIRLDNDYDVYDMVGNNRLQDDIIYCQGQLTGTTLEKVHVASGSGTLAEPYVFAPGPAPVPLTRGTGDKINEWTLTNGMPAGNVLLTVAYKDRTAMALKYGEQAITDEANAVTAYKGFEKEFADALNLDAAVKNIEPALSGGDAVAVTTTAADYIFESSDGNKIGFKTATKGIYDLTGTLDQMEFRDLTENSPVTLTVNYKGTADLESSMAFLRVTIEKKTYTVSLADNTEDADSWKGNVNDAQTDVNLPITKLDKGDAVTLKYNGRLKVKNVTATTDAANTYLMWDAAKKELVEAEIPETVTKVTNADDYVTWAAGTYLVEGNVTINGEVKLSGDVELIIKDGAKLTANYIFGDTHNLNIYGQANKSGELNVACSGSDAICYLTILNIHSCKVNASSSLNDNGGFYGIGEFNVYGGSVDAKYTGDEKGYGLCDISSLNIWHGEMKAEGKGNGNCSYGITIFGGATNVTVYGGKLWVKSADSKALDPDDDVTFTKDPSYTTGVIETSDDGTEWTPYTDAGKPNTKYVRVGY